MRKVPPSLAAVAALACVVAAVRADIVVGTDGSYRSGKIIEATDKDVTFQPDGSSTAFRFDRTITSDLVHTDVHGGEVLPVTTAPADAKWDVPKEPAAPPVATAPALSYYVIPLHGEVGSGITADALEKSLADAVARKAPVVVLDINSPGGYVSEAIKIVQVLHKYNQKIRIVALADQDFSAAAILTLSVRQIYLKPTGTIGAATSFVPGHGGLPAIVDEKMNSAWRAIARNSAQEGGHEPLLADAMIDNTKELHLDIVEGRALIGEGPGEHMLTRQGEILTLTSREAVACGLAYGQADDLDDLGKKLGMDKWTEVRGLGALMGDYLEKRQAAYEAETKKIAAELALNLEAAKAADPTTRNSYVVLQVVPQQMQRIPAQSIPGRGPAIPQPMPGQGVQRVVQAAPDTRNWKLKSLTAVVALQKAERNLQDAVTLAKAFNQSGDVGILTDTLTKLSALRQQLYDDRNKYGTGETGAPRPVAPSVVAGNRPAPPPPARGPGALVDPAPADATAQLKKIEAGWQPSTAKPADILAGLGAAVARNADRTVTLNRGQAIGTNNIFQAPVTFRVVALTNQNDLRLAFPADQIIFNWEVNPSQLRVDGGPANAKHKDGAGLLPANEWVGIELVVKKDEMVIYVDGQEKYRQKGDFSAINRNFTITDHTGTTKLKSVTVLK
ncbi:MAG TPA: hypothetical protein VHM90_14960 [Phycisphaerae bacterium]|nr:hypothetical protein [Phycisphaerae bacterium]